MRDSRPGRARLRLLAVALASLLVAAPGAAGNGVMMQYFHWYLPADGSLWRQVERQAAELARAGFTALWLPPATKGAGGGVDVGYGVYDLYDLGEFDQKGSVRTKYGTAREYLDAVAAAQERGLQVYADVVVNHKGGADATEWVRAVRVARDDRDREVGPEVRIQAWTRFDFPGRRGAHSAFGWRWYHFDGVDWAQDLGESAVFKFRGVGKAWDWPVDGENRNYDYLMFADLDFAHPEVVGELRAWGEWYLARTGVDGFRLDAVKHIRFDFFADWLEHLRAATGRELFAVGEYWSYDVGRLRTYLGASRGTLSLFDAPLHLNFHQASVGGGSFDMREILDGTLVKDAPTLAVTLVDNHDTQPCQALESPVADWFKPLAYAFILLRAEGYPNVFYADYYGARYRDCREIEMASHREVIDLLLAARREHAWGPQVDYLDHPDVIGWTRQGDPEHPRGLAVVLSDGPGGSKWMDTGRPRTRFRELTGAFDAPVITNEWGWGEFPVRGGSLSVWIGEESVVPPGQVLFVCRNGHTRPGESVHVVGSLEVLGAWNPERSLPLSPTHYPEWRASVAVPTGVRFEWKCLKKNGDTVSWQAGRNNPYPGRGERATGAF